MRPPPGRGRGLDRAAVCGGDGADDGQAQAGAAAVVGAVGGEAAERFEQRGHVLGRDGLAGVANGEHGPGLGGHLDLGPAARLVIPDRVAYQVGQQPLQQQRVAWDRPLGEPAAQGNAVLGGHFLVGVDHRDRQLVQPAAGPANARRRARPP